VCYSVVQSRIYHQHFHKHAPELARGNAGENHVAPHAGGAKHIEGVPAYGRQASRGRQCDED